MPCGCLGFFLINYYTFWLRNIQSLINLKNQMTDFQLFLRTERNSEEKCPEVTTFRGKKTVGILSPVPGAFSKSNGFEEINQDTAVLSRE